MSTPNDIQALLASIRPRPSPNNGVVPNPQQNHQQHPQQHPHQHPHQRPAQPYQPGMFPPHPQYPPYDAMSYPHSQMHGYHHPSVSSAIQSPSPDHQINTPPHHGSDILSPNVPTPRGDWNHYPPQSNNPDRAANLLSLLRFSQGAEAAGPATSATGVYEQSRPAPIQEVPSNGHNISASDLVSSLFGGMPAPAPAPPAPAPQAPAAPANIAPAHEEGAPSDHTQDILLRLLNRSQQVDESVETPISVAAHQDVSQVSSIAPEPLRNGEALTDTVKSLFESVAKPETVVSPSVSKDSMFTYVNPFDQLAAISPRTKSPQPRSDNESAAVEFTPELDGEVSDDVPDPAPAVELAAPHIPNRSESPVLEENQRQAVNDVVGRLVSEIGRSLSIGSPDVEAEIDTPAADYSAENVTSSILNSLEDAAEAQEVADLLEVVESAREPEVQPASTAATAGQTRNENTEALVDSWESAEDSAEKEEERVVSVRNFPLKPFISIAVKPRSGKHVAFRDDGIMDIARLKKEFDQLDRSLTSATSDYIVYALPKTGGIRIIRQDDGSDRQVFRSTRDRVFNVSLSTSVTSTGQSDVQAVLGIGVSGTVYWSLISRDGKDLFELDALESESLIFPPFPASDENTSGGQLKTRAKRSTRRADLFAIGRGKNIYVVSPQVAMNVNYGVSGGQRTVNTEKFFKERALKISTGKAGKDFAFSDDDTVIASLDKTGRLRFWDIRDVLDGANFGEGITPNEVRVPLNTFVTGSPAEKSWPTSVLFLDKLRPYSRSTALRYVLVGLKQNHTLQLWDIGLGKAVEEVKFPHENESDAICSVAYHPSSGIIVVGHPTRNSIYFVHLSAPKYSLTGMSQAAFIKAAGDKDSNLPKPDSTACLSGIREISLGSKGQLRSLELLPAAKPGVERRTLEEGDLFELYVMHSRGVTCLNIKREDLGWTSDNRVISPIDALAEGSIEITDLQSFPSYIADEPSINGDTASTQSRAVKETKKADVADSSSGIVPSRNPSPTKSSPKKKTTEEQLESIPVPSSTEKSDKKKKKKASDASVKPKEPTVTSGVEPLPFTSHAKEIETIASSANMDPTQAPASTSTAAYNGLTTEVMNEHFHRLRDEVSTGFNASLSQELEKISDRISARFDEERRDWDAASSRKQENILNLVSEKLGTNVDSALERIITKNFEDQILPTIKATTAETVFKVMDSSKMQGKPEITKEQMQSILPGLFNEALRDNKWIGSVSQKVTEGLKPAIRDALDPLVAKQMATYTLLSRMQLEQEREATATKNKLDQLETAISSMADTLNQIALNQRRASRSVTPGAATPGTTPGAQTRSSGHAHRVSSLQGNTTASFARPNAPAAIPQMPVARAHAPALHSPTGSLNDGAGAPDELGNEILQIRRLFEQRRYDEAMMKVSFSRSQFE